LAEFTQHRFLDGFLDDVGRAQQCPAADGCRRAGMVLAGSDAIPTLSEWALVLLVMLTGGTAYVTMRRRS